MRIRGGHGEAAGKKGFHAALGRKGLDPRWDESQKKAALSKSQAEIARWRILDDRKRRWGWRDLVVGKLRWGAGVDKRSAQEKATGTAQYLYEPLRRAGLGDYARPLAGAQPPHTDRFIFFRRERVIAGFAQARARGP
jgi:hypothetical protein